MVEITEAIAAKVRDTVDAGLVAGVGIPVPGQMCVEAAVCYALGLLHGDDPGCVASSLRELKIRLNDLRWSSSEARAKGLRRLAVAQLGSLGVLDDDEFNRRVLEMTIRRMLPLALRAAAARNPKHAEALEGAALRCEQEGTREAARHAKSVASNACAYGAYAASAAACAYAYDHALAEYAEWVVEILIDLKAPGCQWLSLVPLTAHESTGH